METTIQNNPVFAFRTLGTKDPNNYLIQSATEPDGQIFVTPKLKQYALTMPPAVVYCRLCCDDGGNNQSWRQDWPYTLKQLFPDDTFYDFKVESELERAQSGKRRYQVTHKGYVFSYNTKHDVYLRPGQVILCRVQLQESREHNLFVDLFPRFPEQKALRPETLFQQLGYDRKAYNKYFLMAEKSFGSMTIWARQHLQKVRILHSCNDPHWLLKFIDFVTCQLLQGSDRGFFPVPAWKLQKDLIEWVLDEKNNYLLNTSSVEYANSINQEYTQLLRQSKVIIAASDLLEATEANKVDHFITETVRDFSKHSMEENMFRSDVVGHLVCLDPDFGIRNCRNIVQLVKLNRKYGAKSCERTNGNLYKGLYSCFNRWFSKHICDEETDQCVIEEMVFALGIMINNVLEHRISSEVFKTDVRQLYVDLVQLLSRLVDQPTALQLINRTVCLLGSGKIPSVIDFTALKQVNTHPHFLANALIYSVEPAKEDVHFRDRNSYVSYHDQTLVIGNLPVNVPVLDLEKRMSYRSIPGTALAVADITGSLPEEGASLTDWRVYWSHALSLPITPATPFPSGNHVLIRTFAANSDKQLSLGLVIEPGNNRAGGFHAGGYLKHAYITDMSEIFANEAFLLHANTKIDSKGHLMFDISGDIKKYSWKRTQKTNPISVVPALCIGFNRATGWAFFVTETGICAMARPSVMSTIGRSYQIRLDNSKVQDGYPTATVEKPINKTLSAPILLKSQLRAISEENLAELCIQGGHTLCMSRKTTVPVKLLNEYLRLIDDPVVKYNVLHLIRLYSRQVNQVRYNSLSVDIQYMEAEASLREGTTFHSSLPDFIWPDEMRSSIKRRDFEEILARCHTEVDFQPWTEDQWVYGQAY